MLPADIGEPKQLRELVQNPKLYFYKLATDNGGAPCADRRLLSLAICKPMIRSTAAEGDIIFGFAANQLHEDNRLIYVAVVLENLRGGKYFSTTDYSHRGDCIYKWHNGEFKIRADAHFHENGANLEHDLGRAPEYPRANVLLSEDFRYFGGSGIFTYKDKKEFSQIKEAVEALGRGHRVNEPDELRNQLNALKQAVWKTFPTTMLLGKPTQPVEVPVPRKCGASCVVHANEICHHPDD